MTIGVDVTSPTLWYAPYGGGDSFPVLDGALTWQSVRYTSSGTDQVGAALTGGAKWTAGSSRDIFGTSTGAICSGPVWPAPDRAARHLVKYNGIDVNSAALTCDVSASSSVSCPQYQCTYLGSINSSVAGQLTANFSYGKNRKFEVWTAYNWNQIDIVLHVGATDVVQYNPTNQYQAWQPFGPGAGDPLNRGNPFTGLATLVDVTYYQSGFVISSSGPSGFIALVGWDGVAVGYYNKFSHDDSVNAEGTSGHARHMNNNTVGLHMATMLVAKANASTTTLWGAAPAPTWPFPNINHEMLIRYKG